MTVPCTVKKLPHSFFYNNCGKHKDMLSYIKREAQLLLRDSATFVSFEYVGMLSADTVYPS